MKNQRLIGLNVLSIGFIVAEVLSIGNTACATDMLDEAEMGLISVSRQLQDERGINQSNQEITIYYHSIPDCNILFVKKNPPVDISITTVVQTFLYKWVQQLAAGDVNTIAATTAVFGIPLAFCNLF